MHEKGEKCLSKSILNVDFLLTLLNKYGILEEKKQRGQKMSKKCHRGTIL